MLIRMKKVYYCEYCRKHSLRSLSKHEQHCTSNPDRECRLCGRTESVMTLIDKYKKVQKPDIKDIIDDVDGCPNCTLTIIKKIGASSFEYDYQKELTSWWNEKNDIPEDGY